MGVVANLKARLTLETDDYLRSASKVVQTTESMGQATENVARRSQQTIKSVMASAERQFDSLMKTPLQRQMEKLTAAGGSAEDIQKLKAMHAQMDAFRAQQVAAEKAARAAEAAAAQQARDVEVAAARAARAKEIAVAQAAKNKQVAMARELAAAKEAMQRREANTREYANSLDSSMFGKTAGPLLKGFMGFKAVEAGLGLFANFLSEIAQKGPKAANYSAAVSNTIIDFVNGLPGGDKLISIADSMSRIMGIGSNAEDEEKQRKFDEQSESFRRSMQIRKDAADRIAADAESERQRLESEKQRKAQVFQDLMRDQYIQEQSLLGNKTNIFLEQLDKLRNQKDITEEQYAAVLKNFEANRALEDSLKRQAELQDKAKQAADAAARREEMRREAEERREDDQQSFLDDLQDQLNRRNMSERDYFILKMQERVEDEQAQQRAIQMWDELNKSRMTSQSASAVTGISSAVGSIRMAGSIDYSQQRMASSLDMIKSASQKTSENTAKIAEAARAA